MATRDPTYNHANQPPPPGQGYYAQPSSPSPSPPRRTQQYAPPPPPSDYSLNSAAYEYGNGGPAPSFRDPKQHNQYARPYSPSNANYAHSEATYRTYAPSDPRPHAGNMMEPYSEEKAYAEYTDAYGQPGQGGGGYGGGSVYSSAYRSRPPNDYELGRERGRYGGGGGYESEESWEDREWRRERRGRGGRERSWEGGRREKEKDRGKPLKSNKDWLQQGDGQTGWASALLGGAAGAWLGHESGRGVVGTLSGLAVGALGGRIVEKQIDKHQEKKREKVESSNPDVFMKGDADGGRRRRRDKSRDKSRGRRSSSSGSYDSYDAPPRRSQSGRRG